MPLRVPSIRRLPGVAIAILFAALPFPQVAQTPTNSNRDIFDELAPGGVIPQKLNLPPAKRVHAIHALLAARRAAAEAHNDPQQEEITYLLATLGYQYERNRDDLLRAWAGCVRSQANTGCDAIETTDLLIKLFLQGHKELLRSLFSAYPTDNAALEEGLGGFMGDRLAADTPEFLEVLSTFPPKAQRQICLLAGSEDGSGMPPRDFARAMRNLKAIGGELAVRCERQVLTAKKDAEDAERQQ